MMEPKLLYCKSSIKFPSNKPLSLKILSSHVLCMSHAGRQIWLAYLSGLVCHLPHLTLASLESTNHTYWLEIVIFSVYLILCKVIY